MQIFKIKIYFKLYNMKYIFILFKSKYILGLKVHYIVFYTEIEMFTDL